MAARYGLFLGTDRSFIHILYHPVVFSFNRFLDTGNRPSLV